MPLEHFDVHPSVRSIVDLSKGRFRGSTILQVGLLLGQVLSMRGGRSLERHASDVPLHKPRLS